MTIAALKQAERTNDRARADRKILVPRPTREKIDLAKLEQELADEFRVTFAELAK